MQSDNKTNDLLARLAFKAIKLPAVYLFIGIALVALSYIDNIFPLISWKRLFDFTDKIGNLFIFLAIATFIYNIIISFCDWYEKRSASKHPATALILSSMKTGLRIIFILVVINIIIILFAPNPFYLVVANNIIHAIIIGSIGWLAIRIIYTSEAVIYQQMLTLTQESHLRVKALYTKVHILRNIATVIIIVITIAMILMSFSSVRNVGISLLASAGFITAIIGLAAQKTLFSLFSGLQIALSQPIKIGDIVVIGDQSGIIEEITFTYVTLKLGDRRRLIVPITYFVEKEFENWSHEIDSLRSSLHFHVDHLMPIEPLRHEIKQILQQSPFWDGEAYKLEVSNLYERTVEIRVQVSATNADDLSDLRAEVREKILHFMQKNYAQYFPCLRFHEHTLTPHGTGTS